MIPFRVIRSGVLLGGLLAALSGPLRAAETAFTATLTVEETAACGLTGLSDAERAALDSLVAGDIARARLLKTSALPGKLADRHNLTVRQAAGLGRLTPEQLARVDELVDAAIYANRPPPKERPRLKDSEVLSEQGRLQVHGGMSFTYGWAGGGRNFRETAAWVSYYDPVTGLGVGFGYSQGSGDYFPRYYPDNYYGRQTFETFTASPSYLLQDASYAPESAKPFVGDGASLRGPASMNRMGRGGRHH